MFIAKFLCKELPGFIFYGRPDPRFISISMVFFSTPCFQICTENVILLPCFSPFHPEIAGVYRNFGTPAWRNPLHLLFTSPSMFLWERRPFFLVTPPWVMHWFDLPLVLPVWQTYGIVYVLNTRGEKNWFLYYFSFKWISFYFFQCPIWPNMAKHWNFCLKAM